MKKKILITIIVSVAIVTVCFISNIISEAQKYSIDEAYEYPITQYDVEWVELKTKDEAVAICQIPKDILLKLTTDALIETVINYPFIMDYYAFDKQFNAIIEFNKFNGFRELMSRKDLTTKLLDCYKASNYMTVQQANEMNIENERYKNSSNIEEYVRQFSRVGNIEFLITCDQMLNGDYSTEEKKVTIK